MEYGYVLNHYSHSLPENAEIIENRARNMEDIGLDSIWTTDHVLLPSGSRLPKYETITETITTLSYLAGITSSVNLGLSTLVLPLRNAILVAKQLSSIYYFIGDRLRITFGAGWSESEFGMLEQGFTDRGSRFDEQLEVIRALFAGQSEYTGEYYSFENVEMNPRRQGLDEIPIYIAGNSKSAIKRAETYGDGWHPVNLSPEEITELLDYAEDLDPSDIILRLSPQAGQVQEITENYKDIGIKSIIYDDVEDVGRFEDIIRYIRSFQDFQP